MKDKAGSCYRHNHKSIIQISIFTLLALTSSNLATSKPWELVNDFENHLKSTDNYEDSSYSKSEIIGIDRIGEVLCSLLSNKDPNSGLSHYGEVEIDIDRSYPYDGPNGITRNTIYTYSVEFDKVTIEYEYAENEEGEQFGYTFSAKTDPDDGVFLTRGEGEIVSLMHGSGLKSLWVENEVELAWAFDGPRRKPTEYYPKDPITLPFILARADELIVEWTELEEDKDDLTRIFKCK